MKSIPNSLILREAGLITPEEFQTSVKECLLSRFSRYPTHRSSLRIGSISEIVPSNYNLFIIAHQGKCIVANAHDLSDYHLLSSPSERSKTVFVNKFNKTAILVFTYTADERSKLRCKVFSLAGLTSGDYSFTTLFESENLASPGFMEFDDVNGVILTRSSDYRELKIWRMSATV